MMGLPVVQRAMLWRAARRAVINGVAALRMAFAPGGVADLSLIAQCLQMSAIYVTAHHVLRIVLAVTLAKMGSRWVG